MSPENKHRLSRAAATAAVLAAVSFSLPARAVSDSSSVTSEPSAPGTLVAQALAYERLFAELIPAAVTETSAEEAEDRAEEKKRVRGRKIA